jgi:ribonuclease HII
LAILAGIDEAGFGPVLGPLVVSAAVFSVPDDAVDRCLWQALASAVTRKAFRRSPCLPIADSKSLHVRTDGPVHLERGVLGMARQLGAIPGALPELLARLAPDAVGRLPEYPWYAGQELPLPRQADATDLSLRANAAAEAMRRSGTALECLRAECVLVGEYNRLVAATRNKAVALLGVTGRLIWRAFDAYAGTHPMRIMVDRQGGRKHYLTMLQRMFEGASIRILEESDQSSAYHLTHGHRQAVIHFATGAEGLSLPVALASMLSKYLRELLMELLNRWWVQRVEGLRPTAGYYVDGHRFLRDIEPALAESAIDRDKLVRSR